MLYNIKSELYYILIFSLIIRLSWTNYDYDYVIDDGIQDMRINDGRPAKRYEFPYVASICYRDPNANAEQYMINGYRHICGASIIAKHWLITAAHCLYFHREVSEFRIIAGILKPMEHHRYLQINRVSEITLHPHFFHNITIYLNDIALIKIQAKYLFNGAVEKVSLPVDSTISKERTLSLGWGSPRGKSYRVSILRVLEASILPIPDCSDYIRSKMYRAQVTDKHVCILPNASAGICLGDAGSPLIQNNVLIGIVSYTLEHCEDRHDQLPYIYTRVDRYLDFINKHIFSNN